MKKLLVGATLMLAVCATLSPILEKDETEILQEQIIEKQESKSEIDLQAELVRIMSENANRMIQSVQNEIEIILMEECGEHTLSHNKISDGNLVKEWFAGSSIELTTQYKAILSISVDSINFSNQNGTVVIYYNTNNIKVKSVEIIESVPVYDKSLFGKKYTNAELLGLIQNSKKNIYEQINSDQHIIKQCENNLNNVLFELGYKYGVSKTIINGTESTKQPFI